MMLPNANAAEREELVLQVSENDPLVWGMVLNIAHEVPNQHQMSNISGGTK